MKMFAVTALFLFVSASAFAMPEDTIDDNSTTSATTTSTSTRESSDEEMAVEESPAIETQSADRSLVERRSSSSSSASVSAAAPAAPAAAPASTNASVQGNVNVVEAQPAVAGDLRAPSPKILDNNRRGYFQLGAGPAYGAALKSDSFMYNVVGSYNFNVSNYWTLKALADLYLASGSVSSRLYNFGVGAEYYLADTTFLDATPYLAADVGLGFARNANEETANAVALGAGAGFKFQARELNFDINAHYEQLTAEVGNQAPALFALRGSVMF